MEAKCSYCGGDMIPTSLATPYGKLIGGRCPLCEFEYASYAHLPEYATVYFPDEEKLKEILKAKENEKHEVDNKRN